MCPQPVQVNLPPTWMVPSHPSLSQDKMSLSNEKKKENKDMSSYNMTYVVIIHIHSGTYLSFISGWNTFNHSLQYSGPLLLILTHLFICPLDSNLHISVHFCHNVSVSAHITDRKIPSFVSLYGVSIWLKYNIWLSKYNKNNWYKQLQ